MKEKNKVYIILTISVIGFLLGLLLNILDHNSLIYNPPAFLSPDYTATMSVLNKLYMGISPGRGYFPVVYVIMNIIKFIFGKRMIGFFITFAVAIGILFYFYAVFFKGVKHRILMTICLFIFSYPLFFNIERKNVEYLVLAFLVIFFIAYKRGKYNLATMLLSVPICMKLYPAVFMMLFLKNKKYKEFLLCGFFSAWLMVWSFLIVGGNVRNLSMAVENFSFFTELFAKQGHGIPFNHTLWTLVCFMNLKFGTLSIYGFAEKYIQIYTFSIIIVAVLLILYLLFIEKEEWKIITILTIMMIMFPHVSFDYTLIHMYIPILFFIINKNTKKWEDIVFAGLLAFSIIPMNWFQTSITPVITVNIGLLLRPLILVSIIVMIVVTTIKNRKKLLPEGQAIK